MSYPQDQRLQRLMELIERQVSVCFGDEWREDITATRLSRHLNNNIAQAWPVIMDCDEDGDA